MTYDQWKTTDRSLYYDEPEEEEHLEWDDMEPLDEDDDEFFPDMEALVAAAEHCADCISDR